MNGYFLASFIAEEKDPIEISFSYAISNPLEVSFEYNESETTVINITSDGISIDKSSI